MQVARMTFFGGFLLGGSTGYRQAVHTYEINNVGRKYLSPSDAIVSISLFFINENCRNDD